LPRSRRDDECRRWDDGLSVTNTHRHYARKHHGRAGGRYGFWCGCNAPRWIYFIRLPAFPKLSTFRVARLRLHWRGGTATLGPSALAMHLIVPVLAKDQHDRRLARRMSLLSLRAPAAPRNEHMQTAWRGFFCVGARIRGVPNLSGGSATRTW
jgi:hypothetical protein